MKKISLPFEVLLDSCCLRMINENNAPGFWNVVTDAEVRKQIDAFREINNINELLSFIEKFRLASNSEIGVLWGIFEKTTMCLMGVVGAVDLQDVPSIFYALLPEYRHKGIATECVFWLSGFLHNECCKLMIMTEVHEDNVSSKNVLLRCGYKYDSVRKLFCHFVHYV